MGDDFTGSETISYGPSFLLPTSIMVAVASSAVQGQFTTSVSGCDPWFGASGRGKVSRQGSQNVLDFTLLTIECDRCKRAFFSALGIKPAHSACRMLGLMSRLRVLLVLLRVTFLRRSIGHMRRRLRNVVLRMVFCALCAFRHIRLRMVTRRVRHVMRRLFRWSTLLRTWHVLLHSHVLLILWWPRPRSCVYVRIG